MQTSVFILTDMIDNSVIQLEVDDELKTVSEKQQAILRFCSQNNLEGTFLVEEEDAGTSFMLDITSSKTRDARLIRAKERRMIDDAMMAY